MADKELTLQNIKAMNIFEKLSAISLEITNVAKNLTISMGTNGKYKAVGEGDVLAAVRPTEAKYRVYSFPVNREIIETGELESTDYKGNVRKQFFERIKITYRFVNMDKPDEFIEIISYGDGIDSGDKSVGKAMTYGDKYALLKAYKIITGEDPDQEASETLTSKTTYKNSAPVMNTKKELSEEILNDLKALGVSLEQIADFSKVNINNLTDEIVKPIIMRIKKKRAKEKSENTGLNGKQTVEVNDDFIGE